MQEFSLLHTMMIMMMITMNTTNNYNNNKTSTAENCSCGNSNSTAKKIVAIQKQGVFKLPCIEWHKYPGTFVNLVDKLNPHESSFSFKNLNTVTANSLCEC